MRPAGPALRLGGAMVSFVMMSACASMRTHPQTTPPPSPPPETSVDVPLEPPSAENNPADSAIAQRVPDASTAPPPCTCAETKAKPKPRPKPKPVHKEAPPQLPTAPVVEETPKGGVVDAQVRSMPVSVMSILGKRVKGAKDEDLGRVVDVLADSTGRVRIAIIDFGGFLGVGNHRIAVDWPLLRFSPDSSDPSLLLSLSPDKLRTAPEYKDNPRPQTLMEASANATPAPAAPTPSTPAVAAPAAATPAPVTPQAAPTPAPPPDPKK